MNVDDTGKTAVPSMSPVYMEGKKGEATRSIPLDKVGVLVAPASLALSGMMYTSGYAQRETLLKAYGLSANVLSEPLQLTLARGYPVLLLAILVAAGFGAFTMYANKEIEKVTNKARLRFYRPKAIRDHVLRMYLLIAKASRWGNLANFAILCLLLGYLAGTLSGEYHISKTNKLLSAKCELDCFIYRTKLTSHVGVLLAEDQQRMIIADTQGAQIIDVSTIMSVTPYIPAQHRGATKRFSPLSASSPTDVKRTDLGIKSGLGRSTR